VEDAQVFDFAIRVRFFPNYVALALLTAEWLLSVRNKAEHRKSLKTIPDQGIAVESLTL